MIRLEFKYDAVASALEEAGKRLEDMTPLYQGILDYMVDQTKQRFIDGVGPDGRAWAPKSPVTLALYAARGDGNRPKPLIGPSGRLSSEINGQANASNAELGSSLEYSAVMQDGAAQGAFGRTSRGGPIPYGNIPARVWLGLSDVDEEEMVGIADDYLLELFEGRGFNG
ncbi:MAG: phage virion morphogenesis protein [Sphingobium sp.]|nr:phage virion morphogenesis protein [Sphingobium sp.]